jgi:hypothetical protein
MSQPTPEEARKADQPETVEELRNQLQKYRKLHSVCKRFINKHKLQTLRDIWLASLTDQRHLLEDICECIGYDP